MRGQQIGCASSPSAHDVMNGTAIKEPENYYGKDVNPNILSTVENTPVKAPMEMTNAIRRQKRTGNLDYIWHSLPVTRTGKPLCKAVIRGTLHPRDVQYTITKVQGQEVKVSQEEVTTIGNSVSISKPGQALSIAGLSINEIKFQEPPSRMSPRPRWGQPAQPVSRHMKPNFLNKKSHTSSNGFTNKRMECTDCAELEKLAPGKNSQTSLSSQCNGVSPKVVNGGNTDGHQTVVCGVSVDEQQTTVRSVDDENVSLQSLPPGKFFIDMRNGNGEDTHKKQTSYGAWRHVNNNEATSSSMATASNIGKLSTASSRHREVRDKNINEGNLSKNSLTTTKQHNSLNQVISAQKSPRLPGASLSQTNNKNDNDNNGNLVSGLSCVQLADSIIGAVNGDITQIYSICQTKMRYADFIEQSVTHRFGKKTLEDIVNSNMADANLQALGRSVTSLEAIQSQQFKSNAPDVTPCNDDITHLPIIKTSHNPKLQIGALNSFFNTSRYMRIKEPEVAAEKNCPTDDTSLNLGKAGRPILKTFRANTDANRNVKNGVKSKSGSFPENGGVTNRLVRFNTCHEVREFTPSEPIRQQ